MVDEQTSPNLEREKIDAAMDLFSARNALMSRQTLDELIHQALAITRQHLHCQTASIFLFSKSGRLRRQAVHGSDRDGGPILNTWFPEEEYLPGDSFTGQAAISRLPGESQFGTPHWSNCLQTDHVNESSRALYENKLGTLTCAAAIPLNGRARTFGVLEVINRLTPTGRPDPRGQLTADDIYWLSAMGVATAATISALRRNDQLELLKHVTSYMNRPATGSVQPQEVFDSIVTSLTGPLTSYKACVLLLASTPDTLEIKARAGEGIVWEGRIDAPIRRGERLVGRVYSTGLFAIQGDIESQPDDFQNLTWMRANNLRATACFPLAVKDRILGTLSIFAGYKYHFDDAEIGFLSSISAVIAAVTEEFEFSGKLRVGDLELAVERQHIIGNARLAGYDHMVTELIHGYKNTLVRLRSSLKELEPSTSGKTSKVLERQISIITKETERITEQFGSSAHVKLNVNHVIKDVVKYFSLELKGGDMIIRHKQEPVPDIEANRAEIEDVFVNLVSNAVRAIQASGQGHGKIDIVSREVSASGEDWIEMTVSDNGCGIRKDDYDRVFRRGFSKYRGGTGMGLYLARRIVNAYGGKISFDSTVGKGTSFVVRLPLLDLRWEGDVK